MNKKILIKINIKKKKKSLNSWWTLIRVNRVQLNKKMKRKRKNNQ